MFMHTQNLLLNCVRPSKAKDKVVATKLGKFHSLRITFDTILATL